MEPVVTQFRSSLGGFNRRDVQKYIEQTATAHKKETADLRERLVQEESRRAELEAALSGLETEKGSVVAEGQRVRESLETSTRTLTRLRGELSETESKLVVAKKELERLQAQVAELEPMADNYAQLKDRVATVELDAHCKAKAILDKAQEEADTLRAQTRQWLEGVLAQYSAVRQGMDALLAHSQALSQAAEQSVVLEEEARRLREQGGLK